MEKFQIFLKKIEIFGNFFEKKRGHLTMFLMAKNRSLFWTETPGKLPILCAHFGKHAAHQKMTPKSNISNLFRPKNMSKKR